MPSLTSYPAACLLHPAARHWSLRMTRKSRNPSQMALGRSGGRCRSRPCRAPGRRCAGRGFGLPVRLHVACITDKPRPLSQSAVQRPWMQVGWGGHRHAVCLWRLGGGGIGKGCPDLAQKLDVFLLNPTLCRFGQAAWRRCLGWPSTPSSMPTFGTLQRPCCESTAASSARTACRCGVRCAVLAVPAVLAAQAAMGSWSRGSLQQCTAALHARRACAFLNAHSVPTCSHC